MTGTAQAATPRGGLARMSNRVMNLAHLVTQNARRHGDRVGFIWGDRPCTWRQIDRLLATRTDLAPVRRILAQYAPELRS